MAQPELSTQTHNAYGIPHARWRIRVFLSNRMDTPIYEEGGFFSLESAARLLALRLMIWSTPTGHLRGWDYSEDVLVKGDEVYIITHFIREESGA